MATWYISPTGNDSTGTGSSGSPWQTLSKAHNSASSGDTVICKTSVTAYTWVSQAFTKNLIIQGESTPIYNPATKFWSGAIFNGGGSTVNWTGNTILTVQDLIFTNATPGTGSSTNTSLFNNSTFTMFRCVCYSLIWEGFVNTRTGVIATPRPSYTITLNASIFYAPTSGSTGLLSNNGLTGAFSTGTVTITNCIVRANNPIMALDSGATFAGVFKNNIFINTGSSVAVTNLSAGSTTYSNNITNGTWTNIPIGSNNLTSDPLFVDAANGDFRLRPSSPAINTGIAL